MKPKTCKFKPEYCAELRINYPGKSILSPYCRYHLAISHVYKKRAEAANDKAELDKVRETSKKTPVQRFYATSAWRNFSHFVLLYYSDKNLMVRCSTDPNLIYRVNDRRIAVGHYLKCDQHKATAFMIENVAPQSVQQNIHFAGNMEEMAKWINRTFGEGTTDWLEIKKNETVHLDKYELDLISKKYLNLFNEELKERNIRNPWINKY